ncbi:MAG: Uma2 family endonuclease [Pseudomonadota bacterium]
MGTAERAEMDAAAFLEWESKQAGKHEYRAGEIFAMGGASDRHVTIAGNVFAVLREQLRGGPCRTYIADMKLRIDSADAFYYPDVMVTCDPDDHERAQYKTAPTLVVEILSPSTEAFDRGAKFADYRRLPTLREYLLIDPVRGGMELFRRDDQDHWVLHSSGPEETMLLESVGIRLTGERVFEDAPPGPETAPEND